MKTISIRNNDEQTVTHLCSGGGCHCHESAVGLMNNLICLTQSLW